MGTREQTTDPNPVAYYRGFHIVKQHEGEYWATPNLRWQSDQWEGPFPSIVRTREHIDQWLAGHV